MQVFLVGSLADPLEDLSPPVTTFMAVSGIEQREIQTSKHKINIHCLDFDSREQTDHFQPAYIENSMSDLN